MAWTNIPDSEFTEGQPVRGITGVALRDNAIAIGNGDTGAPKVQTAAINDGSITYAKLNAALSTNYAVGTYIYASPSGSGNEFSYSPGATIPASAIDGISSGSWRNMGSSVFSVEQPSEQASVINPSLLLRIA